MIRLLLSLFALVTLGAAAAAQDAAELAGLAEALKAEAAARADALKSAPAAPAPSPDPGDGFVTDVERFALGAMRLSRAIKAQGGPADLKCIFRGMSRDASARLETLDEAETRADLSRAYTAYAALFEDAAIIAADPDAGAAAPATCAAEEAGSN